MMVELSLQVQWRCHCRWLSCSGSCESCSVAVIAFFVAGGPICIDNGGALHVVVRAVLQLVQLFFMLEELFLQMMVVCSCSLCSSLAVVRAVL
jgi:hypothetical protein